MTLEQQFSAYQQVFHNCGGQLALMEVEAEIHLHCESCGQSAKEVRFVSKGINAKVFFKEVEYQTIKPGAITNWLEEEYAKLHPTEAL